MTVGGEEGGVRGEGEVLPNVLVNIAGPETVYNIQYIVWDLNHL